MLCVFLCLILSLSFKPQTFTSHHLSFSVSTLSPGLLCPPSSYSPLPTYPPTFLPSHLTHCTRLLTCPVSLLTHPTFLLTCPLTVTCTSLYIISTRSYSLPKLTCLSLCLPTSPYASLPIHLAPSSLIYFTASLPICLPPYPYIYLLTYKSTCQPKYL